jgi:hypothetical protein
LGQGKPEAPGDAEGEGGEGGVPVIVYCALDNETTVECEVEDLGCGAGRIRCLECGGDGNWGKFAPEIVGPDFKCVDCKGTGWQFVSV